MHASLVDPNLPYHNPAIQALSELIKYDGALLAYGPDLPYRPHADPFRTPMQSAMPLYLWPSSSMPFMLTLAKIVSYARLFPLDPAVLPMPYQWRPAMVPNGSLYNVSTGTAGSLYGAWEEGLRGRGGMALVVDTSFCPAPCMGHTATFRSTHNLAQQRTATHTTYGNSGHLCFYIG